MSKQHDFTSRVRWTGNTGKGNAAYLGYTRNWSVETPGKPHIACSNDPLLGGDPGLHNPEDLLIATVSSCHMLWYLHLASDAGVVVHSYVDDPVGRGESLPDGTGRFVSAVLRPKIGLAPGVDPKLADSIHSKIHAHCFIARSVNFPITYEASYFKVDSSGE
ncbi:MAG: OsmC family protein [Pseudomonadota bacterium]